MKHNLVLLLTESTSVPLKDFDCNISYKYSKSTIRYKCVVSLVMTLSWSGIR